jgi:hypothetical protein
LLNPARLNIENLVFIALPSKLYHQDWWPWHGAGSVADRPGAVAPYVSMLCIIDMLCVDLVGIFFWRIQKNVV